MKYFDIWLGDKYLRTCLASNKREALIMAQSMFGMEVIVTEVEN